VRRCRADATVDRSLSQAIQQARLAKKMTQKELATSINEKPAIIQEYEAGKAIPSGALIAKIERALGVRLPRPAKK
jgi:putative transcription factor